MNVYLIIEDGEGNCYVAPTMVEALELAFTRYAEECGAEERAGAALDGGDLRTDPLAERELHEQYEREILQSCNLVGPLMGSATSCRLRRSRGGGHRGGLPAP